jgi:hypothetical protein
MEELLLKTLLNMDWITLTFIIGAACYFWGMATGEERAERRQK